MWWVHIGPHRQLVLDIQRVLQGSHYRYSRCRQRTAVATAVAIAMNAIGKTNSNQIKIDVEGGGLEVVFEKEKHLYTNVFLKGPATFVFQGEIIW